MTFKLVVKNYRCFTEARPAVFEIGPGFTAFIGPNNAGKSTVLKLFYELRNVFPVLIDMVSHPSNRGRLFGEAFGIGGLPHPITDPYEIVHENALSALQIEVVVDKPIGWGGEWIRTMAFRYNPSQQTWETHLIDSLGERLQRDDSQRGFFDCDHSVVVLGDRTRLSLSGLTEAVKQLSNVQYLGPFRNALNEGAGAYFDLQLGTAFVAQWHQWKTGGIKQMNRAIAQVTEDVRRLIGAKTLEINASNELKTLQVTIDGRPHKLSELGAGIAQLIVVLGNALIRKPSFIAIDEPETHLHPSLQLDFLTTLGSYASCGVLFATHSIGLARSCADRIYSVQQTERGSMVRPYEKTYRYAEFLGSMGIAGLQDIGWNKVLLVEGATDVRTFQQWLRKLGKDREVVVIPLGGSSMINRNSSPLLEEVVRLGGRVYAVIDSDKQSADAPVKSGYTDFVANCKELKIECLVTERRATENYLTDRSVKEAFGDTYGGLPPFAVPTDGVVFWGKSENWRAAKCMTSEELLATDVGKFLATM